MLKITQAKAGSTMMELILVSVIVGAASLVVLDNNLSKMDYKDGEYDANKTAAVLEDTLMQHPINSMIRPRLYTMEQGEADKRSEIILRQGFSEISQEALDETRDRYFKNGVTSEKHPITVAASEQFYTLSTMIEGREVCAGFVSRIKGNGGWTSISINGSKLKLSIASGGEVGSLCEEDSAEYDVILEYCQPTAILTCA